MSDDLRLFEIYVYFYRYFLISMIDN